MMKKILFLFLFLIALTPLSFAYCSGCDTGSAGIAITLFILAINGFIFWLGLRKEDYSINPITNLIIKRGCIVIGIYLLSLNSAIMSVIVDYAGIELTREMFQYMIVFGWAGYIAMIYLVIKTLFDTLALWNRIQNEKRGLE